MIAKVLQDKCGIRDVHESMKTNYVRKGDVGKKIKQTIGFTFLPTSPIWYLKELE